jgi:very-short-patch-repair endonuclease
VEPPETARTHSRRKPGTTERARALRHGDNMAEAMLWNELKDRRLGGYKFVRQFPLGPYFADFACRKERLVVEIDGSQHAESQYDRARDAFMREQGFSVIRFWSNDVVKGIRSVCETILAALDGSLAKDVVAGDLRFVMGKRSKSGEP